jgi:hypothetical protein
MDVMVCGWLMSLRQAAQAASMMAGLDEGRELGQLLRRQARLGTVRPVVDQALRTRAVEAMDPVAQGLAIHATDLRRRSSIHSIPDRSQR